MSANLFDDETGIFVVVVNSENQHALWPESVAVPDGWSVAFGPANRQHCLDHVDRSWLDMRPKSLVDRMNS